MTNVVGLRIVRKLSADRWAYFGPEGASSHKGKDIAWLRAIKAVRRGYGAATLYNEAGRVDWRFSNSAAGENWKQGAPAKNVIAPFCCGGGNGDAA